MTRQDGYEKMLDDVLLDEGLHAFRDSLLNESFGALKDNRRKTTLRWIVPLAAAALLLVVFRAFFLTCQPEPYSPSGKKELVAETKPAFYMNTADYMNRTEPAYEMFIQNISLEDHEWLCRADSPNDVLIDSEPETAYLIESPGFHDFKITDSEMLALFVGIPCGLAETKGQGKRLIFMNEEDESRIVAKLD